MVLFFSMVRLVSPLKRGDMLTVCILIYVLTGGIAGYNAAKIHRRFRGTEWIKVKKVVLDAMRHGVACKACMLPLCMYSMHVGIIEAVFTSFRCPRIFPTVQRGSGLARKLQLVFGSSRPQLVVSGVRRSSAALPSRTSLCFEQFTYPVPAHEVVSCAKIKSTPPPPRAGAPHCAPIPRPLVAFCSPSPAFLLLTTSCLVTSCFISSCVSGHPPILPR